MADGMKTCPQCAEEVKRAAAICRYCSYNFVSGTSPNAPAPAASPYQRIKIETGCGKGCLILAGIFFFFAIIAGIGR